MAALQSPAASEAGGRILVLDTARGVALLAMATYHFSWDLEFFGYLDPGAASHGPLKIYARLIAATFLFLAGASLVLGHGSAIRWRSFWTRFAVVVAAALAITAATFYATPEAYIFFGILHSIAAASLLGLLFLRLPFAVTLAFAVVAFSLPYLVTDTLGVSLDSPWLSWLGLLTVLPRSNDYVPLFPWFGAFLLGMAAMQAVRATGTTQNLRYSQVKANLFTWLGRHSLAVYLLHQLPLIAVVYAYSSVFPPAKPDPATVYLGDCQRGCVESRADEALCRRFCACTLDRLQTGNLLTPLQSGAILPDQDRRIQQIASQCTAVAQ